MKILPEHYQYMKNEICKVAIHARTERAAISNNPKVKDKELCFAFGMAHIANLARYVCENIYPYADDTHLATAYKKIIKELGI